MKRRAACSILLATGAGIAGCGAKESGETGVASPKHAKVEAHGNHSHRDHAFDDPDKWAKKWNDPERDKWQHPEEIVAALALKPGAEVVDIGAGTGYMVAPLSKAVGKGGTVLALDISAPMIEYLKKRRADLGPAKVEPRKVAADDPELRPGSIDGVMTLDTWHHIAGPEAYAKKVFEGLKPGGRFVVVEHTLEAESGPPKEMRLQPATVKGHLEAAGFRVEIPTESMPRHYVVVGHKD